MPKKETRQMFQQYLREHSLSKSLLIGNNSVLKFHWANDKLASSYVRDLSEEDKSFKKRIFELHQELEHLKEYPIWLMSKRGQIKSDLHNLYKCYLDPRLKTQWFEMEEILVSLQHEAGPFASIKSMRWFDKAIYAKFIYLKLLESWAPQRSFRLSLDIPISIRAGGSPFQAISAKIHQVSQYGLVIHVGSCSQLKEWTHVDDFMFLKKEMKLVQEKGLDSCLNAKEWVRGLENFTINAEVFHELLEKGLHGQGDTDNFIFIPLDKIKMLSVKNHESCIKNLQDLFKETEDTIHEYISAA